MNENELKRKIENISIWKKGDQRAPHKPLLLLYALAQLQNEDTNYLPYKEVKEKLTSLLIEYGPKRRTYHPEEPFVRLTNDGIWDLKSPVIINKQNPNNNLLLKNQVSGGFSTEVYNALKNNNHLVKELAQFILERHFPETIHEDILSDVGLDLDYQGKRSRDPNFRGKILKAYEYSCAVCGFNVRLGNHLVGVEAAHIKWHQAGGPDTEENGIALCAMHHKLFDRGVFTLNEDRILLVAEEANGSNGFEEYLMKFHGKQIKSPIHPDYEPQNNFLNWHVREVFKGPSRYYVN
ncbi:phosphorothioated DNA-binding restriction endonuclease [Neobacillus sp. Marseille-QA0830]